MWRRCLTVIPLRAKKMFAVGVATHVEFTYLSYLLDDYIDDWMTQARLGTPVWIGTRRGNTYREGVIVFRGQPRSNLRAPQFWGFCIYLWLHPLTQNAHVLQGNVGEGRVGLSWGKLRLPSKESGVPALSNSGGSLVFIPTPFNAERPNSAW